METNNIFENVPTEMLIELLESFKQQMSNNIHRLDTKGDLSTSGYFTAWYFQLEGVLKELSNNRSKYTRQDIEDLVRAVSSTIVQFEIALGRSSNI